MTFLSWDSRVGVPKSRQLGLLWLWSPITLRADIRSRCSLKQSCSSCRELSNDMPHIVCKQVNRVDSWLFLVRNQTNNLTPDLSFDHNLCFRCLNEQCKPISNIYVPRAFQWYKKHHKPLSFDPWNCSMKFWGMWGFTLSHFLTLPGVCDVTPGLPLGPHPCNPLALVVSPELGLRHLLLVLVGFDTYSAILCSYLIFASMSVRSSSYVDNNDRKYGVIVMSHDPKTSKVIIL